MREDFQPTIYIMASHKNGTLYTGVTSNLLKRVYEHRLGLIPGFTTDYGVKRLIYFEQHATMVSAIGREKQIKKWVRQWKVHLIEQNNPDWDDIAVTFGFDPLPSRRAD
ncbi:GIY-YIG nuclease family protein [Rhizorhapis sp. SPR117]|uniref:GIY-YIG nuclease family protein n=1 Tax=Rhizorhapis sp. SPR117 TaxID=2912611 RepID=UPI001F1AB9AD|nr:GIY-YIG nuclease family protein [Rhizorhapis sp. SPR117]